MRNEFMINNNEENEFDVGGYDKLNFLYVSCGLKVCLLIIALIIFRMSIDRSFLNGTFATEVNTLEATNAADESFVAVNEAQNVKYVTGTDSTEFTNNETYKNFLNAKKENTNVVGWIKIQGTLIDYPIMHSKDNSFYLDHNSSGEEDKNGAIYMEGAQNGWAFINMIHGHNLKSGKMFGQLVKYKDEGFCKKHPYIEVARENEIVKYRIFSVFIADGSNEEFPVQFADYAEYREYYAQLMGRSMFKLDTSVNTDDILILNTCSYEFSNAHFIVCAQLMED